MSHGILIIEDELTLAKNMKKYLERADYDVRLAETAEQGLRLLESFKPDIILLDLRLPGMDGLEALSRIRKIDTRTQVILITAHGDVQTAVQAMKLGANDFLSKPIVLVKLKVLLDKAVGQTRMEGALSYYQDKQAEESTLFSFIGESPKILVLKEAISDILQSEESLQEGTPPAALITGETGTGKEIVARALHYNGPRKKQPFVEVNCASIPNNLLEAELFGYERGAFTDAKERKIGLFEAAEGGTLFLDEIGEIDISLQAKLLKALEEKIVRRLGSLRDRKVNVRIIAATNQSLETWVQEGKFRADLFFRLRIIHLTIPPLRERGEDVLLLADHFLKIHRKRYGKNKLDFNPEVKKVLLGYTWPGNVRELRNMIEQTVLLAKDNLIRPNQLTFMSDWIEQSANSEQTPGFDSDIPQSGISLEGVEREWVLKALKQTSWNVTRASKLLGLTRDTLRYRMEKFKIDPPA
ncbi:MAG: sigma-54-dependent transcriptional regulator [Nitrospiria bacterium]